MTLWRRWLTRLGEAISRRSFDADLDDELAFHLETEAERLEREEGLSPREARRRARHDFDSLERCKEDVRDARGLPALTFLGRDLKYGLRELAGHPTFTIVAVLSLALGIGLNVAVFSIVDATLFRPYTYDPDDRLVHIRVTPDENRLARFPQSAAPTEDQYVVLRSLTAVFEEVQGKGASGASRSVIEDGRSLGNLGVGTASAGWFEMLGATPILGRGFLPDDERRGTWDVAVVSHRVWQAQLGGDEAVIGRTLRVLWGEPNERVPVTVVGVLPDGFSGDLYLPHRRGDGQLRATARLAPGITPAQAQAAVERALAGVADPDQPLFVSVVSVRADETESVRSTLLLLWGGVAFVLLIACINVAALTQVRATGRTREVATRLALGASRWRIAQLFLAEGALLGLGGAALGTMVAYVGVQLIRAFNNVSNPYTTQLFPRMTDAGMDGRVVAYTVLVSLVAILLFSVSPALLGSRHALGRQMQTARRGTTRGPMRYRRVLVVVQVALALVLLTGAGLVVKSMGNLLTVDPGFDMERLLTVDVSLLADVYGNDPALTGAKDASPAGIGPARDPFVFYAELVRRVGTLPGVLSAAGLNVSPLKHRNTSTALMFGDRPAPPAGQPQRHGFGQYRVVVGDAFATLGIPVVRGRGLTADDRRGAPPVAVINQALADRYWPDGNPIGQQLWFPDRQGLLRDGERPRQIVGIVGDIRQRELQRSEPEPIIYIPHSQQPWLLFQVVNSTLLVRTEGAPQDLLPAVRRVITDLDRDWAGVEGAFTMHELASSWTDGTRFYVLLFSVLAAVGVGLAWIGVFAVMSYAVAQRTQEIGIRMALGAARRQVMSLVARQGLVLGITGVALGLLGASWLTPFVQAISLANMGDSILYDVEPRDVSTFVVSASLLLLAVLLACYSPARRATRVDPMTVLQHE